MRTLLKHLIALAACAAGLIPTLALAAPVQLCVDQIAFPSADGRVLGHLPYGDALTSDMVAAPPGFALGQCLIQRAAAVDLTRLIRATREVPEIAGTLRAVSCYRSIERQRAVFCGPVGPGKLYANALERARVVAPPGYSEHSTGYAVDFGLRPAPGCPDVDACISLTPAGRWLLAHAREYGFELSFPIGNPQAVTWEPWHWRWVGTSPKASGAATARAVFAKARTSFPAKPAVVDTADSWLHIMRQPPNPFAPISTPTAAPIPTPIKP
ncbi:M15 family metallopeptidase [Sphingomonas sp. ERG5]|uniref:M15 family metallopeptidase n=1 Tax=Sphingomonas sp. ERG5 TaxID=1381597 RepID=UPI000A74CD2C|nr:M15 family metallopeptidase [Sphingomonas sp. ERG5]